MHQWVDALFGMEGANVVVTGPDGAHLASLELMGSPEIEVQTGEYFPQFGISLTNKIVRVHLMRWPWGYLLTTGFKWGVPINTHGSRIFAADAAAPGMTRIERTGLYFVYEYASS